MDRTGFSDGQPLAGPLWSRALVCILTYTMAGLSIELSDTSGLPYYRQITDQVTDLIRSGRLSRGDQLPSLRDLAAQLLVSGITVRRAYADLEEAGLIVRRQGSGTFIAQRAGRASSARARREACRVLDEAVTRARQLGMKAPELTAYLKRRLAEEVPAR